MYSDQKVTLSLEVSKDSIVLKLFFLRESQTGLNSKSKI